MALALEDIPTFSLQSVLRGLDKTSTLSERSAAWDRIAEWGQTEKAVREEFVRRERVSPRWSENVKFVVDTRNRGRA